MRPSTPCTARIKQYGLALGWNSQADEEGHSYAELLGEMTEKNLRQVLAVESLAEEKALQLTEEEEQELQDVHQENIRYSFGEEGTEEQLFEELWNERYLTPEYCWRLMRVGYLAEGTLRETYGVEGEKLSEEEILAWMEEQGIVSANHILIATVDLQTRQPLDEDTLKEKTELAQQLARELQAIEDPAELEKRFTELKEQYCADGNSYVFGEGVMVPEFYEGTLALEVGQVSDPVQSSYGYHIILRRPLHADDTIFTGSGMVNAASLMAQQSFSKLLQDRLDAQTVEYEEGFQSPNILDYRVSNLEDK